MFIIKSGYFKIFFAELLGKMLIVNGSQLLSSVGMIEEESMYYITPPIPDYVFTISIVFLIITGTFGLLANLSIFFLFFTTSAVSI